MILFIVKYNINNFMDQEDDSDDGDAISMLIVPSPSSILFIPLKESKNLENFDIF